MSMKATLLAIAAMLAATVAHAADPYVGKLDLAFNPSAFGAVSFQTGESIGGVQKRFWHLDHGLSEQVEIDAYAAANTQRIVAGPNIALPGSGLDHILNLVNEFHSLPDPVMALKPHLTQVKTGVTFGWNASNLAKEHLKPSFIGYAVSVGVNP